MDERDDSDALPGLEAMAEDVARSMHEHKGYPLDNCREAVKHMSAAQVIEYWEAENGNQR